MRSTFIVCLGLVAAFGSGCAYQGVIVAKRSHAAPFPNSLGIDGIYDFDLRDAAGQVHSQMVPPYVFFAYNVGDYFNDLAEPPAHHGKNLQAPPPPVEELEEPPVPFGPEPLRTRQPTDRPFHPVRTTSVHRPGHASKIAQHHHRRHHVRVAQTHHRKHHALKSAKVHHRSHHHAKVASRHHRKRHHSAT
jgi:hypothetical protein